MLAKSYFSNQLIGGLLAASLISPQLYFCDPGKSRTPSEVYKAIDNFIASQSLPCQKSLMKVRADIDYRLGGRVERIAGWLDPGSPHHDRPRRISIQLFTMGHVAMEEFSTYEGRVRINESILNSKRLVRDYASMVMTGCEDVSTVQITATFHCGNLFYLDFQRQIAEAVIVNTPHTYWGEDSCF
ncbi:MAG: hypothetical protein ACKOXO_07050 [Cyanobium sp.]